MSGAGDYALLAATRAEIMRQVQEGRASNLAPARFVPIPPHFDNGTISAPLTVQFSSAPSPAGVSPDPGEVKE